MTLYNCKREAACYRITKFTDDMDVEASYLTTREACECPAGQRSTCRHRIMLPRFIAHEATSGQYFFDYDASKWIRAGVVDESSSAVHAHEGDSGPKAEEDCPGHVASNDDPKVCAHCGIHIDSLRPDDCAEGGAPCEPKLSGLQEEMILMGFHQPKLCTPAEGGTTVTPGTSGEADNRFKCVSCGSLGFEPSILHNRCTFCDGTFGGNPPDPAEGGAGTSIEGGGEWCLFTELATIPGVTVIGLDDPAKLYNTIAEAVGEPPLPLRFNKDHSNSIGQSPAADALPPTKPFDRRI